MTKDVDLVIQLDPENVIKGLGALAAEGYQPRIPVTPEQFADAGLRALWRVEKHMLVLQLWSDRHRRTPVDVFVYEPFAFDTETAKAHHEQIAPSLSAPIVSLPTLLEMKRAAGRAQDLADIEALQMLDSYRK